VEPPRAVAKSSIFATKAPTPEAAPNLWLRDFKRAASMRKASLIELRRLAFPEAFPGRRFGANTANSRPRKPPDLAGFCRRERRDSNPRPPAWQAGTGQPATTGYDPESPVGAGTSSSSEPAVTGYGG
jgi:hypothetical protein